MTPEESNRARVLLRAAYDLLERNSRSMFVEEAASTLAHYDDADCDGMCLKEDIMYFLDLDNETDPIPLDNKDNEPELK